MLESQKIDCQGLHHTTCSRPENRQVRGQNIVQRYDFSSLRKLLLQKLYFDYKVSVAFICTDSFWPLTCKKIQIGALASVHIKTIILLYRKASMKHST